MGYTDRKNIEISSLDTKVVDNIVNLLESGMWERDAARMSGVAESTYFYWKKNIPEFKEKVELAVLNYKRNLIKAVNVNTIRSGKIALEVLKTRWGKEWNIPKKLRIDDGREQTKRQINIILGIATDDDIESEYDEGEVQGVPETDNTPAS